MEGKLFEDLVEQTGLPQDLISQELQQQIEKHGFSKDNLTLDDLRLVLSEYLQEVILEAKETLGT